MSIKLNWTFNGGLGNQIFQYLALVDLREKLDIGSVEYYASDYIQQGYRDFELSRLLPAPLTLKNANTSSLSTRISRKASRLIYRSSLPAKNKLLSFFVTDSLFLDESFFSADNKNIPSLIQLIKNLKLYQDNVSCFSVEGFWQDPSVYSNRLPEWASLFQSSQSFLPFCWQDVPYISIHVRRGDYLEPTSYELYFSRFSPIQYLLQALQLIPAELRSLPIVVVTDDRSWAEYHMKLILSDFTYFISSSSDPLVDWSLLANSCFSVVGNSTFSYTAAMLNLQSSGSKYRAIIPQWITGNESTFLNGWDSLPGSIVI